MERNDREGVHPNTGGEQTSFGSDLNPTFETGRSSSTGSAGAEPINTGAGGSTDRGVGNRVKSVASSVKEKASGIPAMLADGLQAGAEALRQRRPSTEMTAGGSSVAI